MKRNKRVLVIATSSKTRGGITEVLKKYRSTQFWKNWNCDWIETHIDGSNINKIKYFVISYITFLIRLPSASLIHVHLSGISSVKRKIPFLYIAKKINKPIIIHFHGFSENSRLDPNYISLYVKIFLKADKIIVLSQSWKEGLTMQLKNQNFNPEKLKVLYNPCIIKNGKRKYTKENNILYAGTLNQRKGYKNLILAFSEIADEFPNWKLIFAGNGEVEKGKVLAQKLGISKQVVFKGWVSGSNKENLFCTSKIFCLPSYAEGFPMAVLDAFSYGLPVITTPVGGIPDIAIDGYNMFLFPPDDIEELKCKLKMLIKDDFLQTNFQLQSVKLANNEFSLLNVTNKLHELYQDLIIENEKSKIIHQ